MSCIQPLFFLDEMKDKTYNDSDSVISKFLESSKSSKNTFTLSIKELNEGNTYSSEETFINTVRIYVKQKDFQIYLRKSEKNAKGQICKRIVVCNRKDFSNKNLNSSNKRKRSL